MRVAAGATAIALNGLLHAAAAGAVILAGLSLAVPGVVGVEAPAEAAGHALAFGLASLRVPLEAGDIQGTFAPLTGLAATLWGLVSAARRVTPAWPRTRRLHAAVAGFGFAAACAGAAAVAGALSGLKPSVLGAAVAGLTWGAAATWFGTLPRRHTEEEPDESRGPLGGLIGGRLRRLRGAALRLGPPALAPGFLAAATAAVVTGAWFLFAVVARFAGTSPRAFAGGVLLALAAAPNAAAGLVAVGLGAPVDAVLTGTELGDPLSESLSLWDWGGGIAPVQVALLALAPAAGAALGGHAAAQVTPRDPALQVGLRNGAVMGVALAVVGWLGSFGATATGAAEEMSVRLGFPVLIVLGLALAWGVAGAYAGRSRVTPP